MGNRITSFLVIILLLIVLVQSSFAVYKVYEATAPERLTAKASSSAGSIMLCINNPPEFLPFMCNTTLLQNDLYTCQLFVVEPDNATITYDANTTNGSLPFAVDSNGLASTTPNQSHIGNHTVVFSAHDGSNCDNAQDFLEVNFTVLDINDPPRYLPNFGLEEPMGPYTWDLASSLRGIYLTTYFDDPDNDPLTFSYFGLSAGFSVAITPATEVIFSATECGDGYVFFRAQDPFNATAESGLVELKVPCEEEEQQPSGSSGFEEEECISEWKCDDWSRCFPNGTRRKICQDIYRCDYDYKKKFWEECEYIEQCHNGIQDFFWEGNELNEEGVDCGGPCPACETCDDGILNNEEEAIDCGGPNCEPCAFCDDGIQNFGETGVDCGGPCPACPSCFDGVQNQNETGVDCGGPCPPCTRVETPDVITSKSLFVTILISFLGIVAVLLVLYRLFRYQIHAFLARMLWLLTKNKRKQFLLTPSQKDELLGRIKEFEAKDLLANPKKYAEFQNELTNTLQTFFEMLLTNRKLTMGVGYEQTLESIGKLKTTKQVKAMLKRHFSLLLHLERKEISAVEELQTHLEFLREAIFSLAKVSREDIARPIEEMTLVEKPERIRFIQIVYNALLALEFNEVAIAKKKYLAAYEVYATLSAPSQESIYPLLRLLFEQIAYVSSFDGKQTFTKEDFVKKSTKNKKK